MRRYFFFLLLFFTGCASYLKTQDRLAGDLHNNDYTAAVAEAQKAVYGRNNELLLSLDRGYIYHTAARYDLSINSFNTAKSLFAQLYAHSLSKTAASFAFNDYAQEYRGEDYERALLNAFNALNYYLKGNITDALVELRDADNFLKSASFDSGFVRLLSGILYEAGTLRQDLNDAYVAYRKAYQIYRQGYNKLTVPDLLKANLLALADEFDQAQAISLKQDFTNIEFRTVKEKKAMGQVYIIQYAGSAPRKEEAALYVPIPGDQRIIKVAFPEYRDNFSVVTGVELQAIDEKGNIIRARSDTVEDVDALARQALSRRRAEKIAKTIARNAIRYAAEEKLSDKINEQDQGAALAFDIATGIFNAVVEQADRRSWQLLPARINIARLILKPGRYRFYAANLAGNDLSEKTELTDYELKAGDIRIFIVSSRR